MHGVEAQPNAMSLLLTGGTGFFGRSLLRHIAARNGDSRSSQIAVTVLTRSPSEFLGRFPEFAGHAWLSFRKGDVLLGPSGFPADGAFTHVLHAAADSTLGPKLPAVCRFDQIVAGTRNCLDFAVRVGARRFLLTSSGGVYGAQPESIERIPETYLGMPDPLVATNVYGVAKRVAEHLCALYSGQHGLETVVARCFAFVGPDLPLDAHFAVGNFIRDALYQAEITVAGNGTPVRSYLHQDDLAGWLMALLERGTSQQAYNVGSDEAISIRELAHLVRDLVAPDKPVRVQGHAGADNAGRNRYVPDIDKARAELNLNVTIPLADAIASTAQAIRGRSTGYAANG